MSQYELNRSVIAAADAEAQVVSLQELLRISLDIAGQSAEKRQERIELLIICYLDQVKPYLDDLAIELEEIRQLVPRASAAQIRTTIGAGLAAEKV